MADRRSDKKSKSHRKSQGDRKGIRRNPWFESLEARRLLATLTWTNSGSGSWNVAGNWDANRVPASGDDVIIPALQGNQTIQFESGTTSVRTVTARENLQVSGGTLAIETASQLEGQFNLNGGTISIGVFTTGSMVVNGLSSRISSLTIGGNADLRIASDSRVTLQGENPLTVNGSALVDNFATVHINASIFRRYSAIIVNGAMEFQRGSITSNVTGGSFGATITVNAGASMIASGSSFSLTHIAMESGVVFQNGNFAGNSFNTTLFMPADLVRFLDGSTGGTDNNSFRDINILNEDFSGDLALNRIGTATTANLRFNFLEGFRILGSGSLSVGEGVRVAIGSTKTLIIDGTANFAANSILTLNSTDFRGVTQFIVNATATFNEATVTDVLASSGVSSMVVNDNGRLIATSSTLDLVDLYLNPGADLNPGDLDDNAFNTILHIEAKHIGLLAARSGGRDNRSFNDIHIWREVYSGDLTLSLIGTGNQQNLRYVFPEGFTIAAAGQLVVESEVPVSLSTNQILTIYQKRDYRLSP